MASMAMRENFPRNTESRPEEALNKDQRPSESVDQTKGALLDVKDHVSNGAAQDTVPNRLDFLDYLNMQRGEHTAGPLHFTDSWMDKMANYGEMRKRPDLDPFTFLGPPAWAVSSPTPPGAVSRGCPGWEKSNRIYSQIADASPTEASQALALRSSHYADMIFKAVINGWSSLNPDERDNPIMRTLGDMDQVFSKLDPVSRAAFMYKSHMVLKVSLEIGTPTGIRGLMFRSITLIKISTMSAKCPSGRDHCQLPRLGYDESTC
jgi:hypothetical protein